MIPRQRGIRPRPICASAVASKRQSPSSFTTLTGHLVSTLLLSGGPFTRAGFIKRRRGGRVTSHDPNPGGRRLTDHAANHRDESEERRLRRHRRGCRWAPRHHQDAQEHGRSAHRRLGDAGNDGPRAAACPPKRAIAARCPGAHDHGRGRGGGYSRSPRGGRQCLHHQAVRRRHAGREGQRSRRPAPDGTRRTAVTVDAGADDRALQVAAEFAGAALATIRPACGTTLPSVIVTLQGIIQSTETAAQHVLDAADRSSAAVARLRDGVTLLSSAASREIPETGEVWDDVSQSLEVLGTAIARIGDDMQFQDLTAQYLRAAIDTIEELQEQLSQVLMILPSGAADEQAAPGRLAAKLGSPAMVAPWRQELADHLTKERNADGAAKASQA